MNYDESTALLVVDVQNDFASPDGSLYVTGGERLIGFINEHISQASAAGSRVVYSQDWHPATTPHFAKDGGIWPVHCVGGSDGAEFHPDLEVLSEAIFIRKGVDGEDGYSVFSLRDPLSGETSSTDLWHRLKGIARVVIVGLALDYCVKETALDALTRFDTTVLADGSRAVDLASGDGYRAVAEMVSAGVAIT